jgi:hypothetical protein
MFSDVIDTEFEDVLIVRPPKMADDPEKLTFAGLETLSLFKVITELEVTSFVVTEFAVTLAAVKLPDVTQFPVTDIVPLAAIVILSTPCVKREKLFDSTDSLPVGYNVVDAFFSFVVNVSLHDKLSVLLTLTSVSLAPEFNTCRFDVGAFVFIPKFPVE